MTVYHARWVIPIASAPVRDGWVAVDDGRIVATGRDPARVLKASAAAMKDVDLGNVAILPGLVNAHTHLELSWLRDQIAPADTFMDWVREVMRARTTAETGALVRDALGRAIAEVRASGTILVGDISNTLASIEPLRASPLSAVVFYELIKFNSADAAAFVKQALAHVPTVIESTRVRVGLAPHAPYSVGPGLFQAIQAEVERRPWVPSTVHLGESPEEVEFLRTGGGPWRDVLERLGAWDPTWVAPACGPAEYLDRLGCLDDNVILAHGTQLTSAELDLVARRGATIVTCPRSNRHTGVGVPPVEQFYASRARVAVGTDSLASVPDLNLFSELAALRQIAPAVPASMLLASATREGARALGFEHELGTVEPGRCAELIAVSLPGNVEDVEEYLVGGIEPDQVRWIEETEQASG